MTNTRTSLLAILLCAAVACEPVKRTEIHEAVRAGDTARVRQLLAQEPALVNGKDSLGDTPLHVAAQAGSMELAGLLLAAKADVNARANAGWTALHWAAYWNNKEMAGLLLRNEADVNARNSVGYTPLHWASWRNNKELVELLLAHKADVNAGDHNGRTPLHYAVFWSGTNVVEALVAHHADLNAKALADINSDGNAITPLDVADRYGMFANAELLRKHGAKREQMVLQHNRNDKSPPAHKPSTTPRLQR
ncbi:MAG: ankyrin repeat domain-containing protein [Verrucomicrobia bacterium]|nr:ankyrin repeat domain-containing protein [Verrucomicrobiota bacterium]